MMKLMKYTHAKGNSAPVPVTMEIIAPKQPAHPLLAYYHDYFLEKDKGTLIYNISL